MLEHGMFRTLGVFIALSLVAGCSSEASKKPETATTPAPGALGRTPSGKSSPPSKGSTGSSLDAHREGRTPVSGPLKETFFEFDSYNLTTEARTILQSNAAWLKANPAANADEERRLARPPVHVRRAPMPQKETENRRFSENVISTDKAALLWMYCREIAPFETPTFGRKVGSYRSCNKAPQKCATYRRQIRTVEIRRR